MVSGRSYVWTNSEIFSHLNHYIMTNTATNTVIGDTNVVSPLENLINDSVNGSVNQDVPKVEDEPKEEKKVITLEEATKIYRFDLAAKRVQRLAALTEKQKLLVVGNLCIIKQDVGSYKEGYYISNSSGYPFAFKVDPETVGQYTGLKDKNGKEIYEGDILVKPNRYPFFDEGKPNYVGVVEWIFSQWQYVLQCVNKDKRGISSNVNETLNDDGVEEGGNVLFEIIGNIYENPELLT